MSNVLVSPELIKNLVFVRSLTRENSVTVEFDECGFSVKDARPWRVLHRYDSPNDLYPCGASTRGGPVALHADVSLWHARLGHPGADALHKILSTFPFSCNKSATHTCHACRIGKHVRLPFSSSSSIATFPFDVIHCDVWRVEATSDFRHNGKVQVK